MTIHKCRCGAVIRNVPDYLKGDCEFTCEKCSAGPEQSTSRPPRVLETERVCKACGGDPQPVNQFRKLNDLHRNTVCKTCEATMAAKRRERVESVCD